MSKSAFKPTEIRSLEHWKRKGMRMNPKKIAGLCILFFLSLAAGMIFAAARVEGAALPDSLELKALEMEVAGKVATADSLRRIFTAQMKLAARQKAAQDSLAARQLAAQKKLHALWHQQVTSMPLDSVWVWARNDRTKIGFLAGRYNCDLSLKSLPEVQIAQMKAEMEARKKLRAEIKRQLGSQLSAVSTKVNRLTKRVDKAEKDLSTLRTAVVENNFNIQAALSVLERSNLSVEPNPGNKMLIEAAREKVRQKQ